MTMEGKIVWSIVDKKIVPKSKNVFNMKWVYKNKSDGRYRARLVSMGFKQKEGIDYLHSHSPVLNDSTIRILLSLSLKSEYSMVIVDITKAFLESPLDEDNYIYVPPGYF